MKSRWNSVCQQGCESWQEMDQNRRTLAVISPDKSFLTLMWPGCRWIFLRWHLMNLFSFGVWIDGACRKSKEINPKGCDGCDTIFCSAPWYWPAWRRPEPRSRTSLPHSPGKGGYFYFLIHPKISVSWKQIPCHVYSLHTFSVKQMEWMLNNKILEPVKSTSAARRLCFSWQQGPSLKSIGLQCDLADPHSAKTLLLSSRVYNLLAN